MIPAHLNIAVYTPSVELLDIAYAISKNLGLPLANDEFSSFAYLLVVTSERLELRQYGANAPGPVFVQWDSPRSIHRQRNTRQEAIARAVGVKNTPAVVDATAGLGRDAYILASLGCAVRMIERSPVLFAMLTDALSRADPEISQRLSVIQADGRDHLRGLVPEERPDVVYLDPMYPERRKSALVKKESRLLRAVVGDDSDADELFGIALQTARKRVVVKRPRLGDCLAGLKPTYEITGRSTRFDVYTKNSPDLRP